MVKPTKNQFHLLKAVRGIVDTEDFGLPMDSVAEMQQKLQDKKTWKIKMMVLRDVVVINVAWMVYER